MKTIDNESVILISDVKNKLHLNQNHTVLGNMTKINLFFVVFDLLHCIPCQNVCLCTNRLLGPLLPILLLCLFWLWFEFWLPSWLLPPRLNLL